MSGGTHWLSAKRLSVHGLLLALTLWSIYIWTLATPGLRDRNGNLKGTDFLHFYTLGLLARAHDGAHLYDMQYQAAWAAQQVPSAAGIRYLPLYPPQVSLLFEPFATLPYAGALGLWWLVSTAIYAFCCYIVWRSCSNLHGNGGLALLLAIAFPGFFNLIAWGQTSAIALACFTGMFVLLRKKQDFLAGLVLGFLIFKPQLGLAAAVVFIAIGAWKIVAGAVAACALELGAGALYYGVGPVREWMAILLHVRSVLALLEPRPYQTHCLRTFWSMILPWESMAYGLYAITAVLILMLVTSVWRRAHASVALRYSALLLATVLVSPHLTVYDLVVLAPAALLLASWVVEESGSMQFRMGTLLYLVYALPLLGPLTRYTHVQLSVPAMAALIYLIWKASAKNPQTGLVGAGSDSSVTIPAR